MNSAESAPTPDEQIDSLIRLGMNIPEREKARHFLRHIDAAAFQEYLPPFRDAASGRFCSGADFDDVANLFLFDHRLRLTVMSAAGRVEISMRAQMSAHGVLPRMRPDKLSISLRDLSRRYQQIPDQTLRQKIANVYGMDEKILSPFLHHLTDVRNICAHHDRLWDARVPNWPVLPAKKPALKAFFNFNAPDKLYNTLVILAHLTDVMPASRDWARQLLRLTDGCGGDCEAAMGFPAGWRALEFWRR